MSLRLGILSEIDSATSAAEVGRGAPAQGVAAVIPAHNEAERIGGVLGVLREVHEIGAIVVVDDGSIDGTGQVVAAASAVDARVRCLRLPVNGGKGAALFAGAREAGAQVLLFLDADLTGLTPRHVRELLQPVAEGRADMTLGLFREGHINTDFSHWLTPGLTGQRCLRADLFLQISEASAAGYGVETAITLAARRHGWRSERVALRGVSHPPSEFHHGLWHGLRVRARMYWDIARAWHRERGWTLLRLTGRSRRRLILMLSLAALAGSVAYDRSMASAHLRLEQLPMLSLAHVGRLLVVAPHPDDETIGAAGAMQLALANGAQVKVVIVTNGDGQALAPLAWRGKINPRPADYILSGEERQAELRTALQRLGLSAPAAVFLGYPDGQLTSLWLDDWTSACPVRGRYTGRTRSPYADVFDSSSTYCGQDLLRDLTRMVAEWRPDMILVPHPNDEHPDHRATTSFVRLAAALETEVHPDYRPAIWGYLVHYGYYPQPRGLHASQALLPPVPLAGAGNDWARIDLTPEMLSAKIAALRAHASQQRLLGSFLPSFARRNELFVSLSFLDLSAFEFDSVPVRRAGVIMPPSLPEPAEESLRRRLLAGADLVGLQVARLGDVLWLSAQTRGPLYAGLGYAIRVKLPTGETLQATWPGSAVRTGPASVSFPLDLQALGNPPVLAFAAEVRQGATLDRTGWHVVVLRND